MAAALAVVALGGSWLIFGNRRLQARLDQVTADRALVEQREQDLQQRLVGERFRRSELADDLRRERVQSASLEEELAFLRSRLRASPGDAPTPEPTAVPTVPSFLLTPGLLKDSREIQRVILPAEMGLFRLHLDLGVDNYESYRAVLHEAVGDEIWTQNNLEADTTNGRVVVSVILPATLLRHGVYYLRLSGVASRDEIELVGRYFFRVLEE